MKTMVRVIGSLPVSILYTLKLQIYLIVRIKSLVIDLDL
nr:MAG TPA: hypothetical protein [Caudoviricetes sp.]